MANRYFNQFAWSLEKNPVHLWLRVNFGATGAPTLVTSAGTPATPASRGIKSIVRNSAGDYTITLQDAYAGFLSLDYSFFNTAAPAAPAMWVKTLAVTTLATPTIEVVFNAAGTPTDPATGEQVNMHIVLKQSTAP